eukprot:TRINITY_DN8631_c0_g1_i1.p1 TRINITY_DN8631_c0_g1~~TRINITY_DN8631_c0_g1_i1.p1  ORF type:complete len:205 (+),score=53.38 TRINITY_DN8631_c0_g1_i1:221-835(+)
MSILSYNGSAVLAMRGKKCVAIASDRRFGVQSQTLATDFQRLFRIHDQLFVGIGGLGTDVQTVAQRLAFRHKLYELREERQMRPETLTAMLSSMLYEKRFGPYFIEPVIAGLDEDGEPFVATMDLIGSKQVADDFVVVGTAGDCLLGACESYYRPNLEPEELFEVVAQALHSAVDRDAGSGWGGVVTIITPDKIITKELIGRMD